MLEGAARSAARHGAIEGVTSPEVDSVLRAYLDSAMDSTQVAVSIKDVSLFDNAGDPPETREDWEELRDVEVSSLESRDLFAVRATVSFDDVALLPLPFTEGMILEGTSILRHE